VTRRERRQRRQRRQSARAVAAIAVTAALGTIGTLGGMAAASDEPQRPHALPRAPVAIEPSLVSASAAVQARDELRYSVAVLEHTAAHRAAAEKASRDSIWDRIAACETQGNWAMRGPSYSGGVGFANNTWSSFGGNEFAPNAGQATREQQIIVAERVRARVGMGAWGCAKRLGLT